MTTKSIQFVSLKPLLKNTLYILKQTSFFVNISAIIKLFSQVVMHKKSKSIKI